MATEKDFLSDRDDAERKRVQLEFTQEGIERLAKLRKQTDARSNAEVIRNALRLYEWLIETRRNEWEIHLVKGDVDKEIEFAF